MGFSTTLLQFARRLQDPHGKHLVEDCHLVVGVFLQMLRIIMEELIAHMSCRLRFFAGSLSISKNVQNSRKPKLCASNSLGRPILPVSAVKAAFKIASEQRLVSSSVVSQEVMDSSSLCFDLIMSEMK